MIIQKILFPTDNKLKREMFFRGLDGNEIIENQDCIILNENTKITSDTYFNSFSIGKWKKYTIIRTLELYVELQGEAIVNVYGSKIQDGKITTEKATSIYTKQYKNKRTYKIDIDIDIDCDYVCVFFEICACGQKVFFYGGGFATETVSKHNIKIALDICTYNRYKYLEKNVETLTKDILNNPENILYNQMEVFIVDNANDRKTLQLQRNKIYVFLQNRKGSAGGFTRGMLEITKRQNFTHCIVMDDDVYLYPAVIERLYCFLKFLKNEYNDALVGGALMRMDVPYIQHESGALWNDGWIKNCKGNYNVLEYTSVLENELEEKTEYMGWWFCCIPIEAIKKRGYPLPVYFHRDDIEYGLRNIKQITLNGICTWHEPFESKINAINEYYNARNTGIVLAVYRKKWYKYCYFIIKNVLANLFLLKYNVVDLMLCGVEDFLRGPDWIVRNDSGDYYNVLKKKDFEEKESDVLKDVNIDGVFLKYKERSEKATKWVRYLLLNGNLKKSKKIILVPAHNFDSSLFWDVQCAYYYNEYTDKVFCCLKSRKMFLKSIARMNKDIIRLLIRYRKLSCEWYLKKEQWTQEKFWWNLIKK